MFGAGLWNDLKVKIVLATVFLGPSMMIALQMSGKNFQHYTGLGPQYGLPLLILAMVALVFKFVLVEGLARYTLYKQDSVFSVLPNLPGPRHWAVWLVAAIYILELAVYSNLAVKAGSSIIDLFSVAVPVEALALAIISAILLFLLFHTRPILEKVVYTIVGTVTVILLYCAAVSLMTPGAAAQYKFVDIPIDVIFLAGSGSGLSLLIYSIWLSDKAKDVKSNDDYRTQLSKVRWSLGLSFFITGVITALVLLLDQYSPEQSSTFVSLMLLCTIILMSGMLLVGMDGRARAIGKMLRQTGVMKMSKERSYRILILLFYLLILAAVIFGTPFGGLAFVASVSSALYAVSGFALIYADRTMPPYAKGGRAWSVLAFLASSFFLIIAFLEEKIFEDYGYLGVPLVIWILLIAAILLVIWKVRSMRRST
jgi:hypothetical protein